MADDIETVLARTNDEDAKVIADFIATEITKEAEQTLQDVIASILVTLAIQEVRIDRVDVDDTQLKLSTGQLTLEQVAVNDGTFRFTLKEHEVSPEDQFINLLRQLS